MKINVKLHPNSSQEKISRIQNSENNYEVWIKEKPIDNKANISIIKFLKKYFKAKKINIKSGLKSKNKVIEIIE
ncbi:MAG: DUF167 domain-containing protein [Nanoarchaeota archaeon]